MEFTFRLDLELMSKARPRFGKGHSYLPAPYRDWKNRARDQLKAVWVEYGLETLENFRLHVEAHGPGRSDADNLIGALLDAGLPDSRTGWRGAWRDDRVTVIPELSFKWVRSREQFWLISIKTSG